MSGTTYLLIVFGIAVALFLGYEGYALIWKQPTISQYTWAASRKYPLLPLLVGFVTGLLFGHFFWQRVP